MSTLTVSKIERLTAPILADPPCGPDLFREPSFGDMKRHARRVQLPHASGEPAYREPNWSRVLELASGLAERTRDLRVAIHLCLALANEQGLPGLRDGLLLIRMLTVPPDENDQANVGGEDGGTDGRDNRLPTRADVVGKLHPRPLHLRESAFEDLVQVEEGAALPLVSALIARGSKDIAPAGVEENRAALAAAIVELDQLSTLRHGPDLSSIRASAASVLEGLGGTVPAPMRSRETENEPSTADRPIIPQPRPPAAESNLEVTDIAGVKKALAKLCSYYREKQPNSPILILLEFSKDFVDADLLAILGKIGPETLGQLKEACESAVH